MMGDRELEGVWNTARGIGGGIGDEFEIEDLLALAAHQRQRAMGRDFGERLEEVEIIGEFGPRRLLALAHCGDDAPAAPEILAQAPDQRGVLAETLDQNRARALERVLRRRDLLVGLEKGRRLDERIALGMAASARRPAARARARGRSAPWCGASA